MGTILEAMTPDDPTSNKGALAQLVRMLTQYSQTIEPWAQAVATYMLADVRRRDESMWRQHSKDVSQAVRRELFTAPTGAVLGKLQKEQVTLIKSLPLQAAERVHQLATGQLYTGVRSTELQKHILETSNVTEARARVIARTETSRAASNLLQARAQWAGSDGYIWRTVKDFDVRDSHAAMEGKYVRWNTPPTLDKLTGHAGCLPNCRCFSEPVFPES